LLVLSGSSKLTAAEYPYLALTFELSTNGDGSPEQLNGQIGVDLGSQRSELCFYVPYNDPGYGFDRESTRKYRPATDNVPRELYFGGGTTIVLKSKAATAEWLSPYVYKIKKRNLLADDLLYLGVSSSLPRLHGESDGDFFFRGFYPQPLVSCPTDPKDQNEFAVIPGFELHAQITIPEKFIPAFAQASIKKIGQTYHFRPDARREFAFALAKEYKKRSFTVGSVEISFFYHSDSFLELEETTKSVVQKIQEWVGPFPFNHLSVVETAEVQALGIPGIVAINQPTQNAFRTLQIRVLNWQHWSLTRQIAAQWFTGSANVRNRMDSWIVGGFIDFLCFQALKATDRNDIFNYIFSDFRLASLNYRQVQDLTAAHLRRTTPFNRLTDEEMKTALDTDQQSPFLFIRHALALRQLESLLGSETTAALLRGFFKIAQFEYFAPAKFYSYVVSRNDLLSDSQLALVSRVLREWWQSEGWPDTALGAFSGKERPDGKWETTVEIEHLGDLKFPGKLRIKDSKDKVYWAGISGGKRPTDVNESIMVLTDAQVSELSIDPNRETFDADRFNNSTSLPAVRFFPGTANSLSDSDYTVFWGPYALRRPGEPFTLGLTGAFYRYLNSGLFFHFEGTPTAKLGGYGIRHQKNFAKFALNVTSGIEQDYYGSRVISVAATRTPLFNLGAPITATIEARQRHLMGDPNSGHYTIGAAFKVVPPGFFKVCGFNNSIDAEYAPLQLSKEFSYERYKGQISGQCNVGQNIAIGVRLFRGLLRTSDEVPVTSFFRINDMTEAGVRIDRGHLKPARSLVTGGGQLSGPLLLPLSGSSFLLANRLRLVGFYDIGRSYQATRDAEYRAGGIAVKLPLGGDLTGAGSISVSSVSLTTILYTKNDEDVSRSPSVLFDFTGDL
jgi:hypothetical protein